MNRFFTDGYQFFEFLHEINSLISDDKLSTKDRDKITDALKRIDSVFGFIFFEDEEESVDAEKIEKLIEERAAAKKEKNFARADEIRDILLAENIILEDTKDGTRWIKKK